MKDDKPQKIHNEVTYYRDQFVRAVRDVEMQKYKILQSSRRNRPTYCRDYARAVRDVEIQKYKILQSSRREENATLWTWTKKLSSPFVVLIRYFRLIWHRISVRFPKKKHLTNIRELAELRMLANRPIAEDYNEADV